MGKNLVKKALFPSNINGLYPCKLLLYVLTKYKKYGKLQPLNIANWILILYNLLV